MSENGNGKKGLIAKLCEAGAAIGWIGKTGRNEFHKYDYATEADLVSRLRGELYSRGVFIFPCVLKQDRNTITVKTKDYNGNVKERETGLTDVLVRWTFVDADSGEKFECDVPGCGEDSGDKGVYKALTGSEKYLLMKAFLIPTGDDPEKDSEEDKKEAFYGGKQAVQAVAAQKIAQHSAKTSAHGESADKGAVPPVQGSAAALKVVQFHDTDADIIMREWKGVPRPWQRIDGNGLGELLAGLERTDQHFKNTFMWCDEGELIWYVMKAKAEDLAAAAVSMGLDAKQAARIAPRVSNSVPEASGEAIANAFPVIESVRKVEQGVTTPFISVKWGGSEHSCFHKSMWQYLENGIGQPADLTLSNPVKKNGKQYQNIVGLRQIGKTTFTENAPDIQRGLL